MARRSSHNARLKFHDIQQNDDEWYAMRGGRVTMSKLGCVMANFGKAFGEPAKKYAKQLAVEQLTGKSIESSLSNSFLDRGHEFEPIAIRAYEDEIFCEVLNGGFYCNKLIGSSPDGRVGDDGLIEVKTAIAHIHYDRVQKQSYDTTYKWQMVGGMKFCKKDYIDFISYCPEFPAEKQLYVKRLFADEFKTEFNQIDERLDEFLNLVDTTKKTINNSIYIQQ